MVLLNEQMALYNRQAATAATTKIPRGFPGGAAAAGGAAAGGVVVAGAGAAGAPVLPVRELARELAVQRRVLARRQVRSARSEVH